MINTPYKTSMRITTLGTSHGDPTYCRFNSSTLVETGGRLYLIDSGEPITALLVRAGKNFDALKAVFVTHMHGDHVGGLSSLIKMLIKYPQEGKHTDFFIPEEEAIPPLEAWIKAQHIEWPSPVISLKVVKTGAIYEDGMVTVKAEPSTHLRQLEYPVMFAAFSYVFRAEGKTIVFTGDLSADFSDFPPSARNSPCDLCVCEATHYPPEKAIPILKNAPIKRLVVSHIGDNWHGDGEKKLREWLDRLPYPAEIAHDGNVFEI